MVSHERRATDDLELTVLKFAAAGATVGVFASIVGDVAAGIVLLGAVGLALEWVLRKIVRPLLRLIGTLEGLAPWMRAMDAWRAIVDEWREQASGELADLKDHADMTAVKADEAAGKAKEAVVQAKESKNVLKAIARQVRAEVRKDDLDD